VSSARVTSLRLLIKTGGDDLRGGDDNAEVALNFTGGSTITPVINSRRQWNNGETHMVDLRLPPGGLAVQDISGVTITTHFGGGCCGDNWNIDGVALMVSHLPAGSGPPIPPRRIPVASTWLDSSGGPLIRFTGDTHDLNLTVSSHDAGRAVSRLQLVLSTGNDDLRGGSHLNDDCDVTIMLTGGRTIALHNVNGGQTWANWTDHTVDVPIPAGGLRGGDVTGVRVHTGFGGGFDGDNWNLQRVQLIATLP
jgi:hypothetical protein